MKLTHESFTDIFPMLYGRHEPDVGADRMHNLRLRGTEAQESDTIPFPRQVSRFGSWQPRLSPDRHPAEEALEEVQSHLDRLAFTLSQDDDDDHPRAA